MHIAFAMLLACARALRPPAAPRALRSRCRASLTDYFALPEAAREGLAAIGIVDAAPAQDACWSKTADGPGAARGESLCLHSPTGSGKTLAMVLPVVSSTLWQGRTNPGSVWVGRGADASTRPVSIRLARRGRTTMPPRASRDGVRLA